MTKKTFTIKDLEKLAKLANLPLTASETKQLTTDLNHVFAYFKVIDNIPIESLSATSSVNTTTNITREDKTTSPLSGKSATSQAKRVHKNYFVVDSIL